MGACRLCSEIAAFKHSLSPLLCCQLCNDLHMLCPPSTVRAGADRAAAAAWVTRRVARCIAVIGNVCWRTQSLGPWRRRFGASLGGSGEQLVPWLAGQVGDSVLRSAGKVGSWYSVWRVKRTCVGWRCGPLAWSSHSFSQRFEASSYLMANQCFERGRKEGVLIPLCSQRIRQSED
eukprot:272165-Chlamydomonas_euryale.AAC.1